MGLSAGLSTTVPDPVGCDGTTEGKAIPIINSSFDFLTTLSDVLETIASIWSGPWPLLNLFFVSYPFTDASISIHFTIDLLRNIDICDDSEINMLSSGASMMGVPPYEVEEAYSSAADMLFGLLFGPGGSGSLVWFGAFITRVVISVLGFLTVTGAVYTAFLAAVGVWVGLIILGIALLLIDVSNYVIHPLIAYNFLLQFAAFAFLGSPIPGIKLWSVSIDRSIWGTLSNKFVLSTTDLFYETGVMKRQNIEKMAIISFFTSIGVGLAAILAAAWLAINYHDIWPIWRI